MTACTLHSDSYHLPPLFTNHYCPPASSCLLPSFIITLYSFLLTFKLPFSHHFLLLTSISFSSPPFLPPHFLFLLIAFIFSHNHLLPLPYLHFPFSLPFLPSHHFFLLTSFLPPHLIFLLSNIIGYQAGILPLLFNLLDVTHRDRLHP